MRTAVLIAVSLLLGGCSHATVGESEQPGTGGSSRPSAPPIPTSTTPARAAAPADGAAISDVISWIEAGRAVDAAGYRHAIRDGETTELGDDVAFSTAAGRSGATVCRTHAGPLACLVDLADPPPRPEGVYGQWKGNWVDFDGTTLQVGSAHADPGPFNDGNGAELPDGAALSFGDYRCRADQAGLFCVNYAHRSAARLSSTGVVPFGCLHPVPAPDDAGQLFSC